jgi:hypothetical protein
LRRAEPQALEGEHEDQRGAEQQGAVAQQVGGLLDCFH